MKKCTGLCKEFKELSEFYKDKSKKDGLRSQCKVCVSKKDKEKFKDKKEIILKQKRKYYEDNKKDKQEKAKKHYHKNKEKIFMQRKRHCKKIEEWRFNNKEKTNKRSKEWYLKNKENINKRNKNRRHNDIQYKLSCAMRTRLYRSIKNNQKSGSAVKDLGCSIKDLKIHLEEQFQEGMNWNNHGSWHIDHRKPLASFDLTDREQLLEAVHFSNLQPLWAKDNLSKGSKV